MSRFKKRSANTTISITAAIFAQKQILKTPLWCGGGNHSMTKYEFLFFGRSEEKGVYQKLLFIVIYNRNNNISSTIELNIFATFDTRVIYYISTYLDRMRGTSSSFSPRIDPENSWSRFEQIMVRYLDQTTHIIIIIIIFQYLGRGSGIFCLEKLL